MCIIRLFLRIGVALGVLAWLANRVDLTEVGRALAASPPAVVFAIVASFAANLTIAFRLCMVLASQDVHVSAAQTFAINIAAFSSRPASLAESSRACIGCADRRRT